MGRRGLVALVALVAVSLPMIRPHPALAASTRLCLRHPSEAHCDGLDPRYSPCGEHARVIASAVVPGGQGAPPPVGHVYLMYSPRCQSKWATYISMPDGEDVALVSERMFLWVTRVRDFQGDDQDDTGRLTSDMVYAPLGNKAYLCIAGAMVGKTAWTGWTLKA